MKAILIALIVTLPIGARAASSEDSYITARDKYIARLKTDGEVDEKTAKQEEAARTDLAGKLRAILGRVAVEGVPAESKLNLDTLIEGELGFGLIDGLAYQAGDDAPRLIVTTPALAKRWLTAHAKWWDSNNVPQDLSAALKSEPFYTQAISPDAAVARFADVPVAKPASASFVNAMLVARRQDIGLTAPDELLIAVMRADRLFIWSAPAQAKVVVNPACEAIWNDAVARGDKAYETYQKSDPKDEKLFEEQTRILQEGDDAFRRCFAEHAASEPFFPALTKQAQELVDKVK
ncbi:MAG TPA: hypothetical protein VK438_06820 [Xanthobacteraceae bacterium]|nr:hypothetical protein [Xanthobacteraceae bacterium]